MDLAAHLAVLWRHRLLVTVGLIAAVLLALFSLARVDFDGGKPSLSYRSNEVWHSASTLFVTQEGFPWGRAVEDGSFGDSERYADLAQLYTALATSDAVNQAVMANAPEGTSYGPEVADDGSDVLPLIYMNGFGPSAEAASTIANRAAETFRTYLASEQARNGIPPNRRVKVELTSRASEADLVTPRSMVRPIFLFLLVFMIAIAMPFVIESIRPGIARVRGVTAAGEPQQDSVVHAVEQPPAVVRPVEPPPASVPRPAAEPVSEPHSAEPAPARRWA
jgi:hypothetical protein